jgi:hypothetical protein
MQAVGHCVEIREPGRDASGSPASRCDRIDLVHGGLEQFLQGDVILAHSPLGDLVDGSLRTIDDLVDVSTVGPVVAELHDPSTGFHETAQHRLSRDDLGVIPGVGRGGHSRDQGMQVRRSADAEQLAATFQLGGHCDWISWLTTPVEIEDAVEHDLMSGPVEVLSAQHLYDTGDGIFGQQHPAENGLLSRDVLRRLPIEGLPARLIAAVEPNTAVVNQRHPCVPLRRLRKDPSNACSTR